jgi:hypothetical protein
VALVPCRLALGGVPTETQEQGPPIRLAAFRFNSAEEKLDLSEELCFEEAPKGSGSLHCAVRDIADAGERAYTPGATWN